MRTVTRLRPWLSSSPQQATDVIPAKVFTSSIGCFTSGPESMAGLRQVFSQTQFSRSLWASVTMSFISC
jgi:hypothetical protein